MTRPRRGRLGFLMVAALIAATPQTAVASEGTIGAGPYKVVSFTPGVELVMEAFDWSWRKAPAVKRLVFKSMPEETTRAAPLKKGEVDIVYLLSGPVAPYEDLRLKKP